MRTQYYYKMCLKGIWGITCYVLNYHSCELRHHNNEQQEIGQRRVCTERAFQEVTSDVIPLVFVLFVPSIPLPLPSASAGTPVASGQGSWTSNAHEASPPLAGGPQLSIACACSMVCFNSQMHGYTSCQCQLLDTACSKSVTPNFSQVSRTTWSITTDIDGYQIKV